MGNIDKYKAAVTGSLKDVAARQGRSIEEILAQIEVVIAVDRSSSMAERTGGYASQSKWEMAKEALDSVQASRPGKVLLISFGGVSWENPEEAPVKYELDGHLPQAAGSTPMTQALELMEPFDGTGATFILTSDGWPDNPESALEVAARFTTPIDCIFIGPAGDPGAEFMKKIGRTHTTVQPAMLKPAIAGLLPPASGPIQL